jgi:DNA-binding NtrC family response regulator
VLSTQELLDVGLLPESVRSQGGAAASRLMVGDLLPLAGEGGGLHPSVSLFQIMEEIERRVILDMLERTGWNQTEAAERFQIPLSTLNQKIKRLGIETRRRGAGRTSASDPVVHAAGE